MWDAIVIGSGIGGLAAAAALGKQGRRVLVLEQHSVAGGLTQTFQRQDWTFTTGVHYLAGVGPHDGPAGQFGRLFDWLTDGALRFAPCANPYDIVHLPGFEFGICHPERAYRDALQQRFPQQHAAIAAWFDACDAARRSANTLMALHSMPAWMAWGLRLLRGAEAGRWAQQTVAEALSGIDDARLRAVLGARWGDYGAPPAQAPMVEHALVTGAYNGGAYYPVGGPGRFVQTLVPAIEAAGGEIRVGADVTRILSRDGRASGVAYRRGDEGHEESSPYVISAMGVRNTAACLHASDAGDAGATAAWQQRIGALEPGLSYLLLFVGLDGDIAAAGAGSANHWIYASEDIGATWQNPADEDAPAVFVTFPSQKDPEHQGKPTAEMMAVVDAKTFAPWLAAPDGPRPADYRALKARIEARMLAQFQRHFPALQPMVRFHELSTPLTQRRYVRSPDGAMYGVEMTAERLTNPDLHVRTPLAGLLLAGQDVTGPGVPAALMGGLMAAATLEPALWARVTH